MSKLKAIKGNQSRKIDKNWEEIFEYYSILDEVKKNGYFNITSRTINNFNYKIGQKVDARNMVKFDYINSLPYIFASNDLTILPISRGEYTIGHYDAYQEIDDRPQIFTKDVIELPFPNWIESIDYTNLTSEAIVLNSAVLSGMFELMFESEYFGQTLSNRMGSKKFNFLINDITSPNNKRNLSVNGSQIEIDGGYETERDLLLIEAKNNTTDSFLIRQLYYPYRLMSTKVNKSIYSIYLQYSDDIFNFSVFQFTDPNDYNSLELQGRYNFRIAENNLTIQEIIDTVKATNIIPEGPGIIFPQADAFNRIIELTDAIYNDKNGAISLEDLTILNNFTYRQAKYYMDAACYLGFVKKHSTERYLFVLTDKALNMKKMSSKDRKLEIIKAILCHEPFRIVFDDIIKNSNAELTKKYAYNLLKNNKLYLPGFAESTRERRASTVASWVSYVLNLSNDY